MRGAALLVGLAACLNLTTAVAQPTSEDLSPTSESPTNGLYDVTEMPSFQVASIFTDGFTNEGHALVYDFGTGFKAEIENRNSSSSDIDNFAVGSVSSDSVMLRGIYELNDGGWRLKPYIGAGFGLVDLDQRFLTSDTNDWTPSYEIRGGVNYNITENLLGRLEYTLTNGESLHFPFGTPAKVTLASHGIGLGLHYQLQ